MKKIFWMTLAAVMLVMGASAQNEVTEKRRYEQDFEWLRATFEANDAGFGYIVERKGRATYELHNRITLEKIRAAGSWSECREAMEEWLMFFRHAHIRIQLLTPDAPASDTSSSARPVEWERWNGDITTFEKQMAGMQEAGFEGVWAMDELYTLGLKAEGSGYVGFIIESSEPDWEPGQVRMKIAREGDEWSTTYYTSARMAVESGKPELIGKSALRLETTQTFRRVSPAFPVDPALENYLKVFSAWGWEPYLEQLNPTTLYMRIPSFNPEYSPSIDKIVADNFDKLTSTESLIIDVRGNGGGADRSYLELLPLIYTGPTRLMGLSLLATPLNIEGQREYRLREFIEKMEARSGEFVPVFDEEVFVRTFDTVYEYPRNVGVIIDGACGSTTEQFLLEAKQSRKTKLFGVSTIGALDASNMLSTDSPDGRFRLHYASSLSARVPGMEIDNVGLQPDYYIDKTIPDHRWVEFVSDVLND